MTGVHGEHQVADPTRAWRFIGMCGIHPTHPIMPTTTITLVDPELRPLAQGFPAVTYSMESLPAIRQQFEALVAMMPPAPDNGVAVSEHLAPGPAGAPPVRVLVYTPLGEPGHRPALLHLHGGGYVLGQPESSDAKLKSLASELDVVIASVDYRLALAARASASAGCRPGAHRGWGRERRRWAGRRAGPGGA